MSDKPVSLPQVAERMGKKYAWMQRHAVRLQRDHNFPRPIPGFGHVWDPVAIEEWLIAQRRPQPTADSPAPVDEEPNWDAVLDARAAAFKKQSRRA